jgi:predicted AAA+ superfamily ATPase
VVIKSAIENAVQTQEKSLSKKKDGHVREILNTLKIHPSHILIVTGIRRCGKSTLMQQICKHLNQPFVFFNFEDPRVFGFNVEDFTKLDEVFGDDNNNYFFDEAQSVAHWEIYMRSLHDREKRVFITGSNASLLSKELGTRLTGRHIQIELFPFSYTEYCEFKKLRFNHSSFSKYLEDGGFPEYLQNNHTETLQQLFRDIIYRDIIVRYAIRNEKTFIDIALFLISNAGKEYSLNKIKNAFGVGSTNSVANYVQWLEDSYLLFSLPRFSWSAKSMSVNPKKIYTIDTGFAQANSLSYSSDSGRLLENAVYLHLRRTNPELYYFKEKGACDFVVKHANKITAVFQVCTEVHSDNLDREVNGLLAAMDYFELETGTIITMNQEDQLVKEVKTITMIPAWKWFTQEI